MVVGLKPVAAGFSGARGLKEGLVEEGSRGTVGKPGEGGHLLTWLDLTYSRGDTHLSAVHWAWWVGLH